MRTLQGAERFASHILASVLPVRRRVRRNPVDALATV
jgi:ABC-type lipoprotein release transport system permease subunit